MNLTWKDIFKTSNEFKYNVFFGGGVLFLSSLCAILIPLLVPFLIDELFFGSDKYLLNLLDCIIPLETPSVRVYIISTIFVCVILLLVNTILDSVQYKSFLTVSRKISYKIRCSILSLIKNIPIEQYEVSNSGEAISLLIKDVNEIEKFIGGTISKILVSLFFIIGASIALITIHWESALFILTLYPLILIVTFRVGSSVYSLQTDESKAYSNLSENIITFYESLLYTRIANRATYYHNQLKEILLEYEKRRENLDWRSKKASKTSNLYYSIGQDIFRCICLLLVASSDITIGEMIAIMSYLYFLTNPFFEIISAHHSYLSAQASIDRINSKLSYRPSDIEARNGMECSGPEFCMRYNNVHFSYIKSKEILSGVSFEFNSIDRIAIVGESGSGKTTIINLLSGLYVPKEGAILFNDVNFNNIDIDSYRKLIALIPQKPYIFRDTIRNNLCMGRYISEDEIWQILDVVCLSEIISELPDMLDHYLGNAGNKFSGGQLQRICIARGLLSQAKMIVMDESTSALDYQLERAIYENISKLEPKRGFVIITHRLESINWVEKVVVLKHGKIIEEGGYNDVVARRGGLTNWPVNQYKS